MKTKHIIIIVFCFCCNFSIAKSNSVDSSSKEINRTLLEIQDADKIFAKSEPDWWEKYSSGIIALITVIGSGFLSYYIAKNQSRKQDEITKKQIDAQLVIAQEQLAQNRFQVEESSRIAMAQVRANNVSAARIEWIQKLRPMLADLILGATKLDSVLSNIKELTTKVKNSNAIATQEQIAAKEEYLFRANEIVEVNIQPVFNQIRLYLNKEEHSHTELIAVIDTFIRNSFDNTAGREIKRHISDEDLIDKARIVLKEAWEQAKKEGEKNG